MARKRIGTPSSSNSAYSASSTSRVSEATLATLLAGLPAGQVVDRFDRRRILVLAEAVRMLAAASVAMALAQHRLTLVHLLVVAAVLGASLPFGGTARLLLVRAVVPSEQLTAALTQEQVRDGSPP